MSAASSKSRGAGRTDLLVVGAGISGVVTAKQFLEAGFDVTILEKSDRVGGLWAFSEKEYGVMSFTHINVSKYNYCFSDFPLKDSDADYIHNTRMAEYVGEYVDHFKVREHIRHGCTVTTVQKAEPSGDVDMEWKTTFENSSGETSVVYSRWVAVATGHHATPNVPSWPGQDSYAGQLMHSVDFKDAQRAGISGERVLVVGIGNSAVDAACHCAAAASCDVTISTRSGAWVVPNYIMGMPTDLYACRFFLSLPWRVGTAVFEAMVRAASGSPHNWGLRPSMRALQAQPTVSPTLVHLIQRRKVKIVRNIDRFVAEKTVRFTDGTEQDFDTVLLCTGYQISLPFLDKGTRASAMLSEANNLSLYKNMFAPGVGSSLAFVGFVQPASGGILSMSETQARWFLELCRGNVRLPSKRDMAVDIAKEMQRVKSRYTGSARHTIQRDPITYCDEIASFIGVKPRWWHPEIWTKFGLDMSWRLIWGTCGSAQYRLVGPGANRSAAKTVRKVPITPLINTTGLLILALLLPPAYKTLKCLVLFLVRLLGGR